MVRHIMLDRALAASPATSIAPIEGGPGGRGRSWPIVLLWLPVFLLLLLLASLPISFEGQMLTAWGSLLVLGILGRFHGRRAVRTIAITVAAFVTLRYLFWRTAYTLPPVDDLASFIPGMVLYGAELFSVMVYALSLFVVVAPMRRTVPPILQDRPLPTVDVLIPTYNEEPELLQITLAAATNMDYPPELLRVYLLDDGGTTQMLTQTDIPKAKAAARRADRLKEICRRFGAHYIARDSNTKAKAGNINAALAHTGGELIAVFDADHVPAADFLKSTVGFFQRDPNLFLAQTPHFFLNPDPLEHNLGTFDRMPSENEMFYAAIQPGLDKWNSAFFCGSAALLRRTAVQSAGGFAGDTVTEDCETALELHSRGWRSVYVPLPLVAGLQPDTFSSFIRQRSRWAQGMLQILLLKNPLFKRGLSLPQRLCYLSSAVHWLFAFARPVFILWPLFYLFFGLQIFYMNIPEFFGYVVPHVVGSALLSTILYGRVRWLLFSELYEYIQSLYISRALLAVLRRPRSPTFSVTAKGETLEETQFSPLARPFVIMVILLLAGLGFSIWRYFVFPESRDVLVAVALWNLFGLLIALAGLGVVHERRQVRRSPRLSVARPVTVDIDGRRFPARIEDFSAGGLRLVLADAELGTAGLDGRVLRVLATAPGGDDFSVTVRICRVRRDGERITLGVAFTPLDDVEAINAVRLSFADSRPWRAWWERRHRNAPGALRGLVFFLQISLHHGIGALFKALHSVIRREGKTKPEKVGDVDVILDAN